MSKARLVPDAKAELALAALRPSEYTAALIQVLQAKAASVRGAKVLEIGSGSGVVLAALGELGAASLCGIDIEEDAVESGMLLLAELGHGETAELYLGDMWSPVASRRFDLIVANLPHFPMERSEFPAVCRAGAPVAPTAARCSTLSSKDWTRTSPPTGAPSSPITASSTSSARARSWPGSACRSALC